MAGSLAVLYTVTSRGGAECVSAFQSVLKHPLVADAVSLEVGLHVAVSVRFVFKFQIPLFNSICSLKLKPTSC